jgi:hypothetical protein
MKLQHALRAFTAKDRKEIRLVAENFPISNYYKTDQLITALGIGEAIVTTLNEKGIPTPLVHTYLRAPQSRMDILTPEEIQKLVSTSTLESKYNVDVDRDSAYEILGGKIERAQETEQKEQMSNQRNQGRRVSRRKEKSVWDNTTTRQIGRTVARELTRGLLGVLGVKTTTRRRSRSTIKFPW